MVSAKCIHAHMDKRPGRPIRLTNSEVEKLREAAACVGLGWTTFVRRAALAAAKEQLRPPTLELGSGKVLVLTDTPEEQ